MLFRSSCPFVTRDVGFGQTLPALAAAAERRERDAAAAASSADVTERERHGDPGPLTSFSSTSQDPETARVSQYSDAFVSAVQQAALSQHQQTFVPGSNQNQGQGQGQGQGPPGVNVHELAKEVAALLAPTFGSSNTNTEVQSDYTGQSSQVPGDRSGLGSPGLRPNEPSFRKGPPRYDEHQ